MEERGEGTPTRRRRRRERRVVVAVVRRRAALAVEPAARSLTALGGVEEVSRGVCPTTAASCTPNEPPTLLCNFAWHFSGFGHLRDSMIIGGLPNKKYYNKIGTF